MTEFKRKPPKLPEVTLADRIFKGEGGPLLPSVDFEALRIKTKFDPKRKPKEGQGVLYINNQIVGSRGNIVCVSGPPKSRKTVIVSSFISSMFDVRGFLGVTASLEPGERVLAIDTEQGDEHYYYSVMNSFYNIGIDGDHHPANFASHTTRGMDTALHVEFIKSLLAFYKPTVIIIDGVVDLMDNINDQEESKKAANMLLNWAGEYNALIIGVIHTNPGETRKMKGAVGSYLLGKCETVLYVEKDKENRAISNVYCADARNKEFAPYSIMFNEDKRHYEIVDAPKQKILPEDYLPVQHEGVVVRMFQIAKSSLLQSKEFRRVLVASVKEVIGYPIKRGNVFDAWKLYYEKNYVIESPEGYTRLNHVPAPDQKDDNDSYQKDLPF